MLGAGIGMVDAYFHTGKTVKQCHFLPGVAFACVHSVQDSVSWNPENARSCYT